MAFGFSEVVFGTISLLLNILSSNITEIDKNEFLSQNNDHFGLPKIEEYDFIIVGAGTGGCLIANKLSEKFNVLLLELGGDPLPPTNIPAAFNYLFPSEEISMHWTSVNQKNAGQSTNGEILIAQGKGLSGSSMLDGGMYNRGHSQDYDHWSIMTGDDSWRYENLVNFFKMTENFIHETDADKENLGHNGPLTLSLRNEIFNEVDTEWFDAFLKAGKELGYDTFENSNAIQKSGFGPISHYIINGKKLNMYDVFIQPILDRKSLKISRYSKVLKIDIDEENRAVGVLYKKHGLIQYAKAKNEIVLSAGCFNTPHILMNSGVGPEEQLQNANIPVKMNLPVGNKLMDHVFVLFKMNVDKPNWVNLTDEDIKNYINNRKGPLAGTWCVNSQAFIVTETSKKAGFENWPDMHLTLIFSSKEIIKELDDTLGFVVSLNLPTSIGRLTLNETHPSEKLIWDPGYLKEKRDLEAMIDGLKICTKIAETNAFKSLGITIDKEYVQKHCPNEKYGSDEYYECFVKELSTSHWHVGGGCIMGTLEDKGAVLDSQLKVKGISNLRVADSSVQPKLVNVNPLAATLVIGQKAIDNILREYA